MSPRTKNPTSYTATLSIKVSPQLKRELERIVLKRKLDHNDLPPRWGLSDYLREIIEDYVKEHPNGG
jgi:hypothetical protein